VSPFECKDILLFGFVDIVEFEMALIDRFYYEVVSVLLQENFFAAHYCG